MPASGRHATIIQAAGLRPAHFDVTGYAEACEGEPEILTGVYTAATWRTFAVIRQTSEGFFVATLSTFPGAIEPTEMERERLLADDPDVGVGQERVIKMLRDRDRREAERDSQDDFKRGEIIEGSAVELEPESAPEPLSIPDSLVEAAGGEGWG